MKICTKCGIKKPLSDFYKQNSKSNGYRSHCKSCCLIYARSLSGKTSIKRYWDSPLGQLNRKRYEYSTARITQLNSDDRKLQNKARQQVGNAVESGKMLKATEFKCVYKGENCSIEARDYHHYLGYEPEHWFNVIPVCRSCHHKLNLLRNRFGSRPGKEE